MIYRTEYMQRLKAFKDNKIIYGINGSQSSDVVETAFKEAGLA